MRLILERDRGTQVKSVLTLSFGDRFAGATATAVLIALVALASGCKPSKQDRLLTAIWNGDTNTVANLLRAGADPNCVSQTLRRETPLIDATRFGHLGIVRMLLGNGANPNATDREGHGPLYYALTSLDVRNLPDGDSEKIIAVLLGHGASITAIGVIDAAKEIPPNDFRSEISRRILDSFNRQQASGSPTNQ